MDMQDNEFDDVFRSKLEGFEAEPSARVWTGIDDELSSSGRKKVWLPILRIAASVIVLITAGLLFIPGPVKIDKPKNPKAGIAKVPVKPTPQTGTITEPAKQPEAVKQPEQVKTDAQQPEVNRMVRLNLDKKNASPVIVTQPQEAIKETQEPIKTQEQPVLAVVSPQIDIRQNVVPDKGTPLTENTLPENLTDTKVKSQAIAQAPAAKQPVKQVKKHGIRNFGDLVNLVVARVDKRKDKAIEFTDSDDDESMITAVNIGPVKVRKEDK